MYLGLVHGGASQFIESKVLGTTWVVDLARLLERFLPA